METNTLLSRSDNYLSNEIDGEIVMMNIETGAYVSLNPTGKSIWDQLIEPKSIDLIIDALTKEYDVSKEICESDVKPFIQKLLDQKIIIRND